MDLLAEAERANGRQVQTIFFGGGTPSLMSAELMASVMNLLRQHLNMASDAEVTLEANPGASEQGRFAAYRQAGVNRLSIGVQSFNSVFLQRIGRVHNGKEALVAFQAARNAGFERINLDLMYGLPQQSLDQALADLNQALDLGISHLSHYQLTLEPNTAFYRTPPALPDDDLLFEMQDACQQTIAGAGLTQYEVSAYAKPGQQARHNLNYWQFGDYLAIGPGAHGKMTQNEGVIRYWKVRHPRQYLQAETAADLVGDCKTLSPSDLVLETMLNGLRLNNGVSLDVVEQRSGLPLSLWQEKWKSLQDKGLLEIENNHVKASEKGRLFLNDVLDCFIE